MVVVVVVVVVVAQNKRTVKFQCTKEAETPRLTGTNS